MEKNFLSFGIDNKLVKILKQNGINTPTPIQEQTIPEVLKGKDVIAQAQTGTGKTIAFILPMIQKINAEKDAVQGLIITPTRELAIQITEEAKKLAPGKGVNILAAYGGQDVERQIRKLKGNVHLVIGTPGRLLDHLRRKTINFGNLEMLVLDEADQMLHMGFLNEVEEIIDQTKKKRQTMFFSATMPKQIKSLVSRYMKDPLQIKIESQNITLNEIKQIVIETTDRGKQDALCKVMDESNPFLGLIFCRTKRRVSALNDDLATRGYNCAELHGDMSQAKREKVMKDFKSAKLQYLIATDIAARGIDVEGITHVFNYDIAQDTESYIHRIGRTGRAGQTGIAYTFVAEKDREALNSIERGIRLTLKKEKSVNSSNGEKNKPKFESKDDFEKKKDYGKKDFKSNKKSGFSNKKSTGKFGDSKGKKSSKGNRI